MDDSTKDQVAKYILVRNKQVRPGPKMCHQQRKHHAIFMLNYRIKMLI